MKSNRLFTTVFLSIFFIFCLGQNLTAEIKNSKIQITVSEKSTVNETSLSGTERAFLNNLASLCGKSFRGKESYTAPGRESWADKKFVMHVTLCEESRVHIPFHVDENKSRTWMFLAKEEGLRFRHDHRHEDGTPEDTTMYGGYADGTGTEYMQKFPADDYTLELLGEDYPGKWQVILSEDLSKFYYRLIYAGEKVFEAEFDLSEAIE